MLRDHVMPGGAHDTTFRWRGAEPQRIEGLSDAVFGFAITLLVISLEVPKTFNELRHAMSGFAAFAASFLLLFVVWYRQYRWFRRYGLNDARTIAINGALLFVVIFYVYPLKFLFTVLSASLGFGSRVTASGELMIEGRQMIDLMVIYSLGFIAVYALFAMLHRHAWSLRAELALDGAEEVETRMAVLEDTLMVGVGVVALVLSRLGSPQLGGLAYALVAAVQWWVTRARGRALAALTPSTAATRPPSA